jgi:hypothetical protein
VLNGLVLLLVIVYLPGGVIGIPAMIRGWFNRDKDKGVPVPEPETA